MGILGRIISPVISVATEGILKLGFIIFGLWKYELLELKRWLNDKSVCEIRYRKS